MIVDIRCLGGTQDYWRGYCGSDPTHIAQRIEVNARKTDTAIASLTYVSVTHSRFARFTRIVAISPLEGYAHGRS